MYKTVCFAVAVGCSVSESVGERTPGRRAGAVFFLDKVSVSGVFGVPSARNVFFF